MNFKRFGHAFNNFSNPFARIVRRENKIRSNFVAMINNSIKDAGEIRTILDDNLCITIAPRPESLTEHPEHI